jgi:fructokinase
VARPLIFGEVLFDRFPDGSEVLGGAPFNVAWHLRGLGADPLLVSRVGDDEPGRSVLRAMTERGMDTSGIQVDPDRPTGAVEVGIEDGEPRFEILADQAYDRIDLDEALAACGEAAFSLLYHGTLALRTREASAAVEGLLRATGAAAFVDVNLREPWWRGETLPEIVRRARWVKLNEAELEQLARYSGERGAGDEQGALLLRSHFDLDLLIVTRGARGAEATDATDSTVLVAPVRGLDVVDTVGAGDALASVVIFGLLGGWPVRETLERAQLLASRICGIRGATSRDPSLYDGLR